MSVLLATHVPDTTGHCRVCRDRTVAPMWPCSLHNIAAAANALIGSTADLAEGGGAR